MQVVTVGSMLFGLGLKILLVLQQAVVNAMGNFLNLSYNIFIAFLLWTSHLLEKEKEFRGYPCQPFNIIILDDADSMTEDSQVWSQSIFTVL